MSGEVADENYKNTVEYAQKSQYQRRVFLTFRQLNALSGMVILSAMGMVSVEDMGFVVFSVAYMYLLSKVAFPTLSAQPNIRVFGEKNRLLSFYVQFSGVISLVFPVAYILEGLLQGYDESIKAAASHVFLLASQISMEGVAFHGGFSLPVFVFVPVFYNSRRIFTIVEWLRCEFYKVDGSARRLYIGRALAVSNMAFWCFNLFGFLLPVFLPKAFKIYYSTQNQKALN